MDNNQEHPLLISVVMDNLFQYINDPEDLRQAVFVCHTWGNRLFTKWRSMATARICSLSEEFQRLMARRIPCDGSASLEKPSKWKTNWAIYEFIKQFEDPKDPIQLINEPFKRIILSGFAFGAGLRRSEEPVDEIFWDFFGPLVTHVTFQNCEFNGNRPERFERMVTEKLPALQSLTFINCVISPAKPLWVQEASRQRVLEGSGTIKSIKVQGSPPINLCRLLNIAPNVEALTLNDDLTFEAGHLKYPEFLDTLGRLGPLKQLDIMDKFVFDHLPWDMDHHWQRLNFPLEHLSLAITLVPVLGSYGWDLDVQSILAPTIRHHAGTLKVLKIFRPPVNMAPRESPFQNQMDSLKELNLSGNLTRTLDFLGKMPNLKMLHVDFRCYDNLDRMQKLFHSHGGKEIFAEKYKPYEYRDIFNLRDEQEIRLEKMEHFHINLDILPTSVPIIANWMPNLKRLEAVLLRDGFRAVCGGLSNLEELVLLHDSRVDDDALTENEDFRGLVNITALRRLKKFHLKQLCDIEKYRLGDKSVYEGFLRMTSLESVHICVTENMTAEAEADLKAHVADVRLTRIHVPSKVKNLDCCKLSKFLEINNILV